MVIPCGRAPSPGTGRRRYPRSTATPARPASAWPSLPRMCSTWVDTVRLLVCSLPAMSVLLRPQAIRVRTSSSRGVRPAGSAAGVRATRTADPCGSGGALFEVHAQPLPAGVLPEEPDPRGRGLGVGPGVVHQPGAGREQGGRPGGWSSSVEPSG